MVHITRRTREGRFFLRPSANTNQLVKYAYAYAAEQTGMLLHGLCTMSTHPHVSATDPRGLHPMFTQSAHRLIALGLKKTHGIEENVWAPGGAEVQRITTPQAGIANMAYIYLNPPEAGFERAHKWPGVWLGPDALRGYTEVVKRPECFGTDSKLPETVVLRIVPPPMLLKCFGLKALIETLWRRVRERESALARERRKTGKPFVQANALRRIPPSYRTGKRPEAAGMRLTFKAATADGLRKAALALRAFRCAYRESLEKLRRGLRNVEFPAGTYLMCIRFGHKAAPCTASPPL